MLSYQLSRRLSLRSSEGGVNPAVAVATTAVALSVAVMILAVAVVVGFKQAITSRVEGFNSAIQLTAAGGSRNESATLTLTPSLRQTLERHPYIEDIALQAAVPAVFKTSDDFKGVYLKSLSGRDLEGFVRESIEDGVLPRGEEVAISRAVADRLRLKVGDKIPTYFMGSELRVRPLRVAAIFNSHFDDYDSQYAFAPLQLVRLMAGLDTSEGSSIAIAVSDFDNVDDYVAEIRDSLFDGLRRGVLYKEYNVASARAAGASYFSWLSMLDMNVWVVIALMTVVATVTLISGMLIIMTDKVRFIALLSALGSRRSLLRNIFMQLALRVALLGLLIGDIIGIGIVMAQYYLHFMPLDPDSYYLDYVPVTPVWVAFLILNIGVLVVAWIVLILPSRFVGKVAPARVLARE